MRRLFKRLPAFTAVRNRTRKSRTCWRKPISATTGRMKPLKALKAAAAHYARKRETVRLRFRCMFGAEVTTIWACRWSISASRTCPIHRGCYYQRGLFRLRLDQIALANQDFEAVSKISPDSDIGYIAAVQQALSSGNIERAIQTAREGIRKGHRHYMLLTMLGEALLRSGVTPASPGEFGEAQAALETSGRRAAELLKRADRARQALPVARTAGPRRSRISKRAANSTRIIPPYTQIWPSPTGARGIARRRRRCLPCCRVEPAGSRAHRLGCRADTAEWRTTPARQ